MLNKKNYKGMNPDDRICEQVSQLNIIITNKICVCTEQTDFENIKTFVDIAIAVQYRNAVSNINFISYISS